MEWKTINDKPVKYICKYGKWHIAVVKNDIFIDICYIDTKISNSVLTGTLCYFNLTQVYTTNKKRGIDYMRPTFMQISNDYYSKKHNCFICDGKHYEDEEYYNYRTKQTILRTFNNFPSYFTMNNFPRIFISKNKPDSENIVNDTIMKELFIVLKPHIIEILNKYKQAVINDLD